MNKISIHSYKPGSIGETVRYHATYYAEYWGFDVRFETQVARELAEFIAEFDGARDGFWWARSGGDFAGAVAVDGTRAGQGLARIRWFIVPTPFQGSGVGSMLFAQAMEFCRAKPFSGVYLWTFEGLGAARTLYERGGFRLVEEQQGAPWGPTITEQKFEYVPAGTGI